MRLFRFAKLMSLKYSVAQDTTREELVLRGQLVSLKKALDRYNILIQCAECGASHPKNANEKKAVEGFKFCQQLVSIIDYLYNNKNTISLGELLEALVSLISLINENKNKTFDADGHAIKKSKEPLAETSQFSHVSELIFALMPSGTKDARRIRDQQYGKARTGLSIIFSIAKGMVEQLDKLQIVVPEKFEHEKHTNIDLDQDLGERFTPTRAPLSEKDIIDFIRQHGSEFGFNSLDDWRKVEDDIALKDRLTTIINALNRGHKPFGFIQDEAERNKELDALKAKIHSLVGR